MADETPEAPRTSYVFGENGTVVGRGPAPAATPEPASPLVLRHRYALILGWFIAGPLNPSLLYWMHPSSGGHFGTDVIGTWLLVGLPSAFGAGIVAMRIRKGAVSLPRLLASSIAYGLLAIPATLMVLGALAAAAESIRLDQSALMTAFAAISGAAAGLVMTFALPLVFYGAGLLLALAFAIPAAVACALVFRVIAFKRAPAGAM